MTCRRMEDANRYGFGKEHTVTDKMTSAAKLPASVILPADSVCREEKFPASVILPADSVCWNGSLF